MAGGKQSPRQKMINLMYLVFLAMMAMNMGKEVLSAFGLMNEKLTDANQRATEQNAKSYESLALKAAEQAKQYGEAKEKTDALKVKADELYAYLDDLKSKMTADVEDKTDYELMDKSAFLDSYFFESGTISAKGKEFVSKVDEFRKSALEVLGDTDLASVVESRFDTDPVKNREGLQINWLNYNYEGFPLIASLTKLTQIQADVKTTESDALSTLLRGELESAVSMTNYDAMVVFEKNAYYPGEKLSGKIVLGKNDPNLTAEKVIINGEEWPKDKIKAGQVILDGAAGGVGDKKIEGTFTFMEKGEPVDIPIKGGYSVIPKPNEAVISADKMNVVYRGLSNPITISMPGVSSNKVSASAKGLRRVKGDSYMMAPGSGNEVTINVTGTLPGGSKVTSRKKFRIKDIPPAVGMIRGQYGTVPMPKSSAANTRIAAGLPDFLFDLKLNVSSFKIKVPGQVAIPCSGTTLNARAKQALQKARRGDDVTIFDIKASVSGSSYKIKKVLPVVINITN
ncbi:gliding motility protein GldM [Tenacibaculum sp. IB213877]|uniref:type IX secretion system motor protein PorM/GldM n=1 Tax=Tenacibaculum sp. IB213877 TaxID=3097351 RepID=UPI002A5AA80B|nr:gliding motility protein GldM [Tenacibaculum sp. IB213877]MDY0780236.1 gliding motility protein GldM [Tenacibaculum sp. IB213877]